MSNLRCYFLYFSVNVGAYITISNCGEKSPTRPKRYWLHGTYGNQGHFKLVDQISKSKRNMIMLIKVENVIV